MNYHTHTPQQKIGYLVNDILIICESKKCMWAGFTDTVKSRLRPAGINKLGRCQRQLYLVKCGRYSSCGYYLRAGLNFGFTVSQVVDVYIFVTTL